MAFAQRDERQFFSTEAVIYGGLLGSLLTFVEIQAWRNHEYIVHNPVVETLWTALYLTAVVAFCGFRLPTFFAQTSPRLAVFTMAMMCGFISLFFDSFAVILLLTGLTFTPYPGVDKSKHPFNVFAFKVICTFNALTVGVAFYLGELYGLPHYIKSGFDDPLAGLPLLIVLGPFCVITSLAAAYLHPVRITHVPFDQQQLQAMMEFVTFLGLIIITHRPILCIGILLIYSSLGARTVGLVKSTLHELSEGGANAIGLILVAVVIQFIAGVPEWFENNITGAWVILMSALSSPFAGAMVQASDTPADLYETLSLLMLGAPLLVSSSLVAIIVFRNTIAHDDLPRGLQWIPGSSQRGYLEEAVAYTVFVLPMIIALGACLAVANYLGVFESAYNAIS